jgi:Phage tail protein (Tail_P2_I)
VSASERLYQLLPSIHRRRDGQNGQILRALLGVIQEELDRVEAQLDETYDNWFIETCDAWVVPYLGDALGVTGLEPIGDDTGALRAYVADTLGFRARKGTASGLEDLARAVTGWPAVAVEMFQRLAATQHLDHLSPQRMRTPDLRDADALERLGGAFEIAGHTVDVRSIAAGRGRYNIPDVAIWLWRLEAFAVEGSPATPDVGAGPARYRFSPLGNDVALYAPDRGDALTAAHRRPGLADLPAPIRRRPIWAELEAARAARAAGVAPVFAYLDADPGESAFTIWERDTTTHEMVAIPPERVQICNLSTWQTDTPAQRTYVDPTTMVTVGTRVAVDPALGRMIFLPPATSPVEPRVWFRHGFPGELGGGLYERGDQLAPVGARTRYAIGGPDTEGAAFPSLTAAITQWLADHQPPALFELLDDDVYAVADLSVPAAGAVELRSADQRRAVLRLGAPLTITLAAGASITLDGLLVAGDRVAIATDAAVAERHVTLRHTTLVPGHQLLADGTPVRPAQPSLVAAAGAAGRLIVSLARTVTGPIDLSAAGTSGSSLTLTDAIVDAMDGALPAVDADAVSITAATLLGAVDAGTLDASDTIFAHVVTVARTQDGCVRYSAVPPGSKVPRTYRCQPQLALTDTVAAEQDAIVERLRPRFTSRRYGDAAYLQLADTCADELVRGASDRGEMGGWHFLFQPVRTANLAVALDEYLRFGLEAGVLKAT